MKNFALALLVALFFVPSIVSAERPYRGGRVRPPIHEDNAVHQGAREARRAVDGEVVAPGFVEPGADDPYNVPEDWRDQPLEEEDMIQHQESPGEVEQLENMQNIEHEPDID